MASDNIGDIFNSFGCFEDTDVPSLFDDLEALSDMNPPSSDRAEIGTISGPSSPEMMSVGSLSPQHELEASCFELNVDQNKDHTYAENMGGDNPVMTRAISPEHERSPSPGGSLSSTAEQEESRDLLLYLMNETGVQVAEKEDESSTRRSEPKKLPRSSTSSSRGRKRHQSDDDDSGEVAYKNQKNAIAARENRLKKKRYIEGLEKENQTLSNDNTRLLKDNTQMKEHVSSLEAEVDYLKSVLYNQSALSGLLKKLGPDSQVRLSSSFHARKQPVGKRLGSGSGGVCLHVNGKDASLEFCAQCGLMAEEASHQ